MHEEQFIERPIIICEGFDELPEYQQQSLRHFHWLQEQTRLLVHRQFPDKVCEVRDTVEKKVYITELEPNMKEYLNLLKGVRLKGLYNINALLAIKVQQRQKIIEKQIRKNKLDFSTDYKKKSIDQMKKELEEMISQVRKESKYETDQDVRKRVEESYSKFMSFRSKGYWQNGEKEKEVKVFLEELRKKSQSHTAVYRKAIKKQIQKDKKKQEKLNQTQQKKHQKEKQEQHQKFIEYQQKRKVENQEHRSKIHSIQHFLRKYKQTPIYMKMENNFQKNIVGKQKQEYFDRLDEIHELKNQINLKQIRQGIKQYENKRIDWEENSKQRYRQFQKEEIEIKKHLKQLFHSKHHNLSEKSTQLIPIDFKKLEKEKINRRLSYSLRISQEYKPTVDDSKRQEISQSINLQKLKFNRIERTNSAGEKIFQEKEKYNSRDIGLSYLQEIKKNNQLEGRKPQKISRSVEVKEVKLKDYSIKQKKLFKYKTTLSDWKNIMENSSLPQKQKQQKVKEVLKILHEESLAKQKAKKDLDHQKSIQIQGKIDQYEINQVNAKIALLRKNLQ